MKLSTIIRRKPFALLIIALCGIATALAQSPEQDFKQNILKSASNYYAYPYLDVAPPALTPPPAGYEPFHINHYGRHGSRWLIDPKQYQLPVDQLTIGERNGKLTPRGKEVLQQLRTILNDSHNRLGELTDKGWDQHRAIARRMYENFPQVFAGNARVNARSSVVVRCILSMSSELQQLRALNPQLRINEDASNADMYYCCGSNPDIKKVFDAKKQPMEDYVIALVDPTEMNKRLFTDQKFAADSINGKQLMIDLWDVASNQQSHYTDVQFYDLFSEADVMNLWRRVNTWWYAYSGNSSVSNFRAPFHQAPLLQQFLTTAQKQVELGEPQATLRFGHESCLLPLACLMELNNAGARNVPYDDLHNVWQNYNIFPMGCNIQWVFYHKPGSSDVIMKVLLNEQEATLPVDSDIKPYYHWDDVRNYYQAKLNAFAANQPTTDVFTTDKGSQVTISHIKHASLMIEVDKRCTIHIDPVAQAVKPTDYSLYPQADLMLVTHEHPDHLDAQAIAQLSHSGTQVIANAAAAKKLPNATVLRNGQTTQSHGITITATAAYNTTPSHTKYHKRGNGNGYLLQIDNLRIYVAGDTEPISEMGNLGNIDVAFLPVNQPYTMTIEQCAQAARTIKPRVLFPYHYSDTPVGSLVDMLSPDGIEVRIR
ncbi:MAG: MBL fold metallo-hydrolase [Muribaculaceae bacterium]